MIKVSDHCAGSWGGSRDESWHDLLGARHHLHNYCSAVCTALRDIASTMETKHCHHVMFVFKELFGQLGKRGHIQFGV